jgi:hypothetical protein
MLRVTMWYGNFRANDAPVMDDTRSRLVVIDHYPAYQEMVPRLSSYSQVMSLK